MSGVGGGGGEPLGGGGGMSGCRHTAWQGGKDFSQLSGLWLGVFEVRLTAYCFLISLFPAFKATCTVLCEVFPAKFVCRALHNSYMGRAGFPLAIPTLSLVRHRQ